MSFTNSGGWHKPSTVWRRSGGLVKIRQICNTLGLRKELHVHKPTPQNSAFRLNFIFYHILDFYTARGSRKSAEVCSETQDILTENFRAAVQRRHLIGYTRFSVEEWKQFWFRLCQGSLRSFSHECCGVDKQQTVCEMQIQHKCHNMHVRLPWKWLILLNTYSCGFLLQILKSTHTSDSPNQIHLLVF